MALNSTVAPSFSCFWSISTCLSNTSSVTWPPPASSAQYPAFAAAATICGSTVVGVMPARRTGALPVSLLNFVITLRPDSVSTTFGANLFQQTVRKEFAEEASIVEAAARAAIVPASTIPAPLPCTRAPVSLPNTSPGPISNTKRFCAASSRLAKVSLI